MSEGLIDPGQIPGAFKAFAATRIGMVYLGGVALSLLAHSTFKGMQSYSAWARNRAQQKSKAGAGDEDDTEEAVSAVLTGIGWGFWRGLGRGWFWPIEGGALAIVFYLKRREEAKKRRNEDQ